MNNILSQRAEAMVIGLRTIIEEQVFVLDCIPMSEADQNLEEAILEIADGKNRKATQRAIDLCKLYKDCCALHNQVYDFGRHYPQGETMKRIKWLITPDESVIDEFGDVFPIVKGQVNVVRTILPVAPEADTGFYDLVLPNGIEIKSVNHAAFEVVE